MALIIRLPEYAGEAEDAPARITTTTKGVEALVTHVYAPTG